MKWRIATAPAEINVHGAQSGAVKTLEPPRPLIGRIVAESITNISMPRTQANSPEARKTLFHMIFGCRADVAAAVLRRKLPGHEKHETIIGMPSRRSSADATM